MTLFIAGLIVGGFIFWNVSVAVERFRRARLDFRMTRRGLRTLVEMMVHRGWQAVQGVLLALVVVAVVLLYWTHRHFQ